MTPTEAAGIVGCSPQQIRTLIRTGKLKAKKTRRKKDSQGNWQWTYDISRSEARRYAKEPQKQGFPRGKKRLKTKGKR